MLGNQSAWTMLSLGDKRQYQGNRGYSDDIASVIRYDSFVANSKQVAEGDLVLIRDATHVLGAAVVERIEANAGIKQQLRCPVCSTTSIKLRHSVTPPYRCSDGHDFDQPKVTEAACTLYAAWYGDSFAEPRSFVSLADIRQASSSPSSQLSIRRLDPLKLTAEVATALRLESLGAFAAALLGTPPPLRVGSAGTQPWRADDPFEPVLPRDPELRRKVERYAVELVLELLQTRFPAASTVEKAPNNAGYDIEVLSGGVPLLFVEVKGTMRCQPVFMISETERRFSLANAARYELHVVWGIDLERHTHRGVTCQAGATAPETHGLTPFQWSGRLPEGFTSRSGDGEPDAAAGQVRAAPSR